MEERDKVYIVDTFGFLFRSYHGIPPLFNRENQPTHLLTGFAKMIQLFQKSFDIQNIIFALEGGGRNFRKDVSADYKANRGEVPEDFLVQFKIILDWIQKMGFPTIQKDGFEADDIIATLSNRYESMGYEVFILSADKDFIQLLTENIIILRSEKGKFIEFNGEETFKKYKIKPHQFIDYQSLVGDTADNVTGVKGIGKVTASKLLTQYENLDNIYKNISDISASTSKKLSLGKDDAYISKKIVTLVQDLDIEIPTIGNIPEYPLSKIVDDMIEFEITEPLKQLVKIGEITQEYIDNKESKNFKFEAKTLNTFEEVENILFKIPDETVVAFDTETTGIDQFSDKIVGFSFSFDEVGGYYIPINHIGFQLFGEEQVSELEASQILEQFKRFKLVGHNFKFDKHIIFNNFKIDLPLYSDTMILAWLNNSTEKLSLDNLSYRFLKHKKLKFKDLVKKGEDFSSVDIETATKYAVEDVVATLKLFNLFHQNLDEKFINLAFQMEIPFSELLFNMENEGVLVDVEKLKKLEIKTRALIEKVESEIYNLAGDTFNLNSPKQVANILFDRLGIKSQKRSTDESTLQSIIGDYPIIAKILKYRKLFKVVSTYLEPLQKYGSKGRIHTIFGQTGTATGRLNSQNPNLQNIPVESGVRNAFISKDGFSLLSLDYSQIELRFFAHFSEDSTMVQAFKNGEDIHSVVAEKLNVKRTVAKTVNFGLLYGMGSKKLSLTLDISENEAKRILESYFENFSTIKDFYSSESSKVFQNGFVTTILGRKRYFVKPTSPREKASIQRESFNTLFQGSSADLIKLAMLRIEDKIKSENLDVKLLLQIHDELIFEVKDSEIEKYSNIFKEIMEDSLSLRVPIVANSKSGKNWGEIK